MAEENVAPKLTVSPFGNLAAGVNTAGTGGPASVPDGGTITPSDAPLTNDVPIVAPAAKTEAPAAETLVLPDAAPEALPEKPVEADPDAEKPEKAETAAEKSEIEAWKAQAEKFGYKIDPAGRVYNQERHRFREWKANEKRAIEQERVAIRAEIDQKFNELSQRETPLVRFTTAVDAGDFDAIAQAVGLRDWATLQAEAVAQASDPSYKRLRALEREKEEKEAREAQAREQYQRQLAAKQEHDGLVAYQAELAKQMEKSSDPLVRALHWDPIFVKEITALQRKHWKESGAKLSAEQIVKLDMNQARSYHRRMYESLKAAFEGEGKESKSATVPAATPAVAPAVASQPAKSPPVQVPSSGSVTPSAARKLDPLSDDWFIAWGERARAKEEAAKKNGRS